MRKRRRILLVAISAAVLGGLVWLVLPARDPLIGGRPESAWIGSLTNGYNAPQFEQWKGLGSNATPILVKALRQGNGQMTQTYIKLWPKLPTVVQKCLPAPYDSAPIRMGAATCLGYIEGDIDLAITALLGAFKDPNEYVRMNAIGSVVRLLPVVPTKRSHILSTLLAALHDPNSGVRKNALAMLSFFPERKDDIVPVLNKAMNDPDVGTRLRVVCALLELSPDSARNAEISQFVLKCCRDPDWRTRLMAANLLAALRIEANRAVPTLTELLSDKEYYCRQAAATVLGTFGAQATSAVPALVNLLKDTNSDVRTSATNALKQIDPEAAAKVGVR